MIMAHTRKKKETLKAEKRRIQELERKLKLMDLKQQEQTLQAKVNTKKFWTEHKNLRGIVSDMKGTLHGTHKFVRDNVAPAMKEGVRGMAKAYSEGQKLKKKEDAQAQRRMQKAEKEMGL